MSEKGQMFAFTVGEVSPSFYGRQDLAKYPLGLATAENYFIDYHGGLLNRPGHEFIAMLDMQPHRFARFQAPEEDLILLFTDGVMRVMVDGKFILSGSEEVNNISEAGVVTRSVVVDGVPYVDGELLWATDGTNYGYFTVSDVGVGVFTLSSPIGNPLSGTLTYQRTYAFPTGIAAADLDGVKFFQDLDTLVITKNTFAPIYLKWSTNTSWAKTTYSNVLPPAPVGLVATASTTGTAEYTYAVTAVYDEIESASSAEVLITLAVNITTTTGHVSLSWTAAAGATRYNLYRSLVFPTSYPVGSQLGYIGFTTGLAFVDMNITPDFTKSPPKPADFFAGSNFPSVFCRFQQRGAYAGLKKSPLTVVGSVSKKRDTFSVSIPVSALDSYEYTIDAQSLRPIKHMLPLQYGLMLFSDNGVTQLKGAGDRSALTAVNAFAEPQGYVSVSDLQPISINLDVLFMTSLYTEVNSMLYTEYTNSFKMQDIAVLSSHLFGADKPATRVDFTAEPHKLLHFIREDGQRVTLTYERNQDVFGWARQRTIGKYLDLISLRENNYNLNYYSIQRRLQDTEVLCLERDKPRHETGYDRTWFVDSALERKLIHPNFSVQLIRPGGDAENTSMWTLLSSDLSWAQLDQRVYIKHGLFRVAEIGADFLTLAEMEAPSVSMFFQHNILEVPSGEWGYNSPVFSVSGLWHLEGQSVSVQADGDGYRDIQVTGGTIQIPNSAARILVGLPFRCRAKSLPLGIGNYILGGNKMTIRGVALRQLNSRGLSVGRSFTDMEELPSRRWEDWGNPLGQFNELTIHETLGTDGWDTEASICMEQNYPLPSSILGFTYELDVGG